jgi:hypothetical protein
MLEIEVVQLLQSLQDKLSGHKSDLSDEQEPCYCDSETKENLEQIVRKQKEVIQLQIDLQQR